MEEANKKKDTFHSLGTRVLSGSICAILILLIPVFYITVSIRVGALYLFGLSSILSLFGLWEFYRLFGIEKSPEGIVGYIGAIAVWVFTLIPNRIPATHFIPLLLGLAFLYFCLRVFRFQKTTTEKVFAGYMGILYVPFLFTFLFRLAYSMLLDDGFHLFVLVFISSWGADTVAYFVGSACGKHPLCPNVSPKKSVEGFIGGLVGSVGITVLYVLLMNRFIDVLPLPYVTLPAIALLGAVAGVFGDLFASALKREKNVKDFSHIIPGHGGILDRFDSVLFAAPVIYYLADILLKLVK